MKYIFAFLILFLSTSTLNAEEDCKKSKFFTLDYLIINKDSYLNKRVNTRAILLTDAKEFSLLRQDENSKYGLRTSYDKKSELYRNKNPMPAPSVPTIVDFAAKLKMQEGNDYLLDLTKIRYYRQVVYVCGRIIRSDSGVYTFAVDDLKMERSYMLPWKHQKNDVK